jgi:threonine aldolase
MCWLDLDAAGCSAQRFEELGREQGLTIAGNRLVTHYQIAQNADDVLPRLQNVFEKVFAEGGSGKTEHEVGVKSMYQTKK